MYTPHIHTDSASIKIFDISELEYFVEDGDVQTGSFRERIFGTLTVSIGGIVATYENLEVYSFVSDVISALFGACLSVYGCTANIGESGTNIKFEFDGDAVRTYYREGERVWAGQVYNFFDILKFLKELRSTARRCGLAASDGGYVPAEWLTIPIGQVE